MADELSERMKRAGHTVSLIHGGAMSTTERDKIMAEFREGTTKVLISTNVLSRGIDVLQVSLVINYDIPLDRENQVDPSTYLHRIGRSGRWGRNGIAINLVSDAKSRNDIRIISETFAREIVDFPQDRIPELETMLKELNE